MLLPRLDTLTVEKAMDSPQLSLINRQLGNKVLGAFIMKAISEAMKLCKNNMDEFQIAMTSKFIIQDYWMLKSDEILLALQNGIKNYRKDYNVTMQTILEWMDNYAQMKMGFIDGKHNEQKSEWGNNADRKMTDKSFNDLLGGFQSRNK